MVSKYNHWNLFNSEYLSLANREKFNKIMLPNWTVYVTQSFFSFDLFRLWSLGYPGVRRLCCGVILVLRTFPELAWGSVQNLVGQFACERGTQGGTAVQSVCFICKD